MTATQESAPAARSDAAVLASQVLAGVEEQQRSAPVAGPPSDGPAPLADASESLGSAIRGGGIGLVGGLTTINLLDNLEQNAFFVLGPEIQDSLRLSDTGLGAISGIGSILLVTAAVPVGYLADRYRRTWIAGGCAVLAAVFTALTGAVQAIWQLVVVRLLLGIGKSSTTPVHNSLLADGYALGARTKILAVHNLAPPIGALLGPLVAGAVAAAATGSEGWRWAFVAIAVPTLLAGAFTLFVREPPRGRNEQMAVLGMELPSDEPAPAFGAAYQRLTRIQTLYFLLVGVGVLGFAIVGVPTFFNVLLEEEYGLGVLERGAVGSLTQIGSLAGVVAGGFLGDRLFRRDPQRTIVLVGASVAAFGVVFAGALFLPSLSLVLVGVGVSNALIWVAVVPIYTFVAAVVPFRLRALGFALLGIYVFLIGGFLGGIAVGALSDSFGPRTALATATPPAAVLAGALVAYGARHVRRDMALVVEELNEERDELVRRQSSDELPVLQIRNVDFSYGSVQVLFDINMDVKRGEVLALLGTNGAGKSTLLKVISGLGIPQRGTVRFDGRTVTLSEAVLRVDMGIVQVPGGKAVFPTLSVRENLEIGAFTFRRDRQRVRQRIDEVIELFPVLRERFEQPAGTLSGGEQQQLAIAKALLLDPAVLLIDELSLGLAPVVVQQLIGVVERLKRQGLTIVIVEQSVNVALALADRAVFMEKGAVRFEGPAAELAERDDLVRAVFLGGKGEA